jgi:sugar phosphate isomerase/epimerase
MRFGVCCPPANTEIVARAGADFVEWPVTTAVGLATDAQFQELLRIQESATFKPEAWNVLLPGTLRVVGPDVDLEALEDYATHAFERVRLLGGEVVVFGSGAARRIPDGWDRAAGERQFAEVCRLLAPIAVARGITLALEPLRQAETNLITSVDAGARLVDTIDLPGLRLLADLYHMEEEAESHAILRDPFVAPHLAHIHVAAPGPRTLPAAERDREVIASFFGELVAIGYDGRISIECRWEDETELAASLAFLRDTWDAVA